MLGFSEMLRAELKSNSCIGHVTTELNGYIFSTNRFNAKDLQQTYFYLMAMFDGYSHFNSRVP